MKSCNSSTHGKKKSVHRVTKIYEETILSSRNCEGKEIDASFAVGLHPPKVMATVCDNHLRRKKH